MTDDMSGDPLRDPRFPDRPQHPDFWRLSETVLKLDGKTQAGEEATDITALNVDVESALYMSQQRVGIMLRELGFGDAPKSVELMMITAYMGGVVHGIEFQKAGGHRA